MAQRKNKPLCVWTSPVKKLSVKTSPTGSGWKRISLQGAQASARSISTCCVRNPVASLLWCPLEALLTTLSDPSLPTLPRESWGPQLQLYSCLFQWVQLYLQKTLAL